MMEDELGEALRGDEKVSVEDFNPVDLLRGQMKCDNVKNQAQLQSLRVRSCCSGRGQPENAK